MLCSFYNTLKLDEADGIFCGMRHVLCGMCSSGFAASSASRCVLETFRNWPSWASCRSRGDCSRMAFSRRGGLCPQDMQCLGPRNIHQVGRSKATSWICWSGMSSLLIFLKDLSQRSVQYVLIRSLVQIVCCSILSDVSVRSRSKKTRKLASTS